MLSTHIVAITLSVAILLVDASVYILLNSDHTSNYSTCGCIVCIMYTQGYNVFQLVK